MQGGGAWTSPAGILTRESLIQGRDCPATAGTINVDQITRLSERLAPSHCEEMGKALCPRGLSGRSYLQLFHALVCRPNNTILLVRKTLYKSATAEAKPRNTTTGNLALGWRGHGLLTVKKRVKQERRAASCNHLIGSVDPTSKPAPVG